MPTYEYECEKCGHAFEKFQSMNDPALKVCPKDLCKKKTWGKGKVHRVIGAGAGLIFKGSGFYITDYRSEGYKEAAKKESQTTPSGGGSESGGGSGKSDGGKKVESGAKGSSTKTEPKKAKE